MKDTDPVKHRIKRAATKEQKPTQQKPASQQIIPEQALPYSRPLTREEKVTILSKLNREIRLDKLKINLIRFGIGLVLLLLLYLCRAFL